jgi:oxygen-independent coproporphyrinogen-3 oxidase
VRESVNYEKFLQGYEKELEFFAPKTQGRKINSIFFGGGTPSLMPIFLIAGILKKIAMLWKINADCEITLEANPTSSEASKFKVLRDIGINRLSIGIQALNDSDLKFLGRNHSAREGIKVIETAAKNFSNFSFDLIYARPQQNLEDWRKELQLAINFGTKHLSLYQLTIEKGTQFFSRFMRKEFKMPDENLSAEFYEMTNKITSDAGLELYEISNYAQKNYRCRHNMAYWQGSDYLGIGAGAHSRIYLDKEEDNKRSAITMLHEPLSWLKKVQEKGAGIQKIEKIAENELVEELILTGLRLSEGLNNQIFQTHCQKNIAEIFDLKKLAILANKGLLTIAPDSIKISSQARLLTNAIIKRVCEALIIPF